LTLPLGVWKAETIDLHPFPREKQTAIRELEFGNVFKVILRFRERWWPIGDGFYMAMNEPLPTWWTDPRGPVITGWAGGSKAESLLSLSAPKLRIFCLDTLRRIFAEPVSKLRTGLVALHFHHWENDPDIRGAYSYIPVDGLNLPGIFAAPVAETLFFAGEATVTDAQMGTVFGALDTGLRAAHEIVEAGPALTGRRH
jgi:monoamine oxidase